MTEVKFPNPKTDITTGEVRFASPCDNPGISSGLSPGDPVREYLFAPVQTVHLEEFGFSQPLPKLPALPGVLVKLVDKPDWASKDPEHYTIPGKPSESGVIYSHPTKPLADHHGLIIMCHGRILVTDDVASTAYRTYFNHLGRYLAANGFIAVSIRHPNNGTEPARKSFIDHATFLLGTNAISAKYQLKSKPLVLLGQSEGGSGAALAAKDISNQVIGTLVTSVKALVGLAPAPSVAIDGHAEALLIMQGSHDGDWAVAGQSIIVYEAAVSVPRHFIWIFGATHIGFLQPPLDVPDGTKYPDDEAAKIKPITQRIITSNYVTAFLRWVVRGESIFRPPFIGDGTFNFAQDTTPDMQADLKKNIVKSLPRYDIKTSATLCQPEHVVFKNIKQQTGKFISAQYPAEYESLFYFDKVVLGPQITKCFRVQWNRYSWPNPQIWFPCKLKVWHTYIEFHAVLAGGLNPLSFILPTYFLYVENNILKKSNIVNALIQAPLVMHTPNVTKALLSTVRIPLSSYGAPASLAAVTALVFDFQTAPNSFGDMAFTTVRVI